MTLLITSVMLVHFAVSFLIFMVNDNVIDALDAHIHLSLSLNSCEIHHFLSCILVSLFLKCLCNHYLLNSSGGKLTVLMES